MHNLHETQAPVELARKLADDIANHALSGLPEEVCGIIRGRGLRAYEVVRGRNVASEPTRNFTVDADTLLRQFEFEDAGDEMMGIYHSHPADGAYPSATDAWLTYYPDAIYFICSLAKPHAPVLRAYSLRSTQLEIGPRELRQIPSFTEARPGVFAAYYGADAELPPLIQSLHPLVLPPAYLLYSVGSMPESRIVTIAERPIHII